ncbi:Arc family DNA-binding protein [Lonsdalea quercina]|uniref:Arc family DNA-binding protein n=1 Tax=Lonsdalea quercina TaxID=71657 RepID=UPI003976188B
MAKYPSQMQDKFNLRFPDGMRDAVAERAKANGRSMNSEIVQIIQDALDEDPEKLASEAIDKVYFDMLGEMDNDELEAWFKAIKEHTKALNQATSIIKGHNKKPT